MRLVLLILLPLSFGCNDGNPKRVQVSGTVLIDGEPLIIGNIRFVPPDDRASYGKIDGNGSFTLKCFADDDGAVLGTHKVQVTASEIVNGSKVVWHAPRKYANARSSGLTVEITEPIDDLVIALSWDGEKKPRKKKR